MEPVISDVMLPELDAHKMAQAAAQVETALLTAPLVEDCRVLARRSTAGSLEFLAYVVMAGQFAPERLQAHLQRLLPAHLLPSAYLLLPRLPLTPTGAVDDHALAKLPIINAELAAQWEHTLAALPEIDEVAVVIEERAGGEVPLHLSDLLPDWKPIAAPQQPDGEIAAVGRRVRKPQSTAERKAISHGGPLQPEIDAAMTLKDSLLRAAQQQATQGSAAPGVVYVYADGSERTQSYAELLQEAERILAGLRGLGLQPQDKVIFQFNHNDDFIPAFWGCVLGGFVVIPIAVSPSYAQSSNTTNKLVNAWQMLDRPFVLTAAALAPAIQGLFERFGAGGVRVATIEQLRRSAPDNAWHENQPDDLAILLLTSGSTGMPKAVMQTHRTLLSRSAATVQMNGFSQELVSFNWMPLDHVGGIVMYHLRDVYLACRQIHAPIEFILTEPLRWLEWIERHRVNDTWAPNFAFGLINENADQLAHRAWDLSSLQSILNGGEAIVAKTARRFLELLQPYGLSGTAMRPAYGMSETCSGITNSYRFTLETTRDSDQFVEVGAPIPMISIRIVDAEDQLLDEGEIGRLQIRGATVTPGYYNNPEQNWEVFTADGWFKTGDLALLRAGRLTITGREKDVIIIYGINYYSHEVEAVVEEIEGVEVSYTAAVAVRDAGSNTDALTVFFVPADGSESHLADLAQQVRVRIAQALGVTPTYVLPVAKEVIPKTEIGKIQRSQLVKRFQAGEFDPIVKQVDLLTANANTLPNWFYRRVWHPKAYRPLAEKAKPQGILLFVDSQGLGVHLARVLEQEETPCIRVEAGAAFARSGAYHYRINPQAPDDYRRLMESLSADGLAVGQILHLWTYRPAQQIASLEALEEAQTEGLYCLLFLVQALAALRRSEQTANHLMVVANHLQPVLPEDDPAYEHSPSLGLLRMLSQELPWLRCRHIDLDLEPAEVNGALILQELNTHQTEGEIAYRKGTRWAPQLEKVEWSQAEVTPLPFKRGGMYLLSGGLGGIGIEVARYLLTHFAARLVLVGRSALPDPQEWSAHLAQACPVAEKIAAYQSLAQLDGEVFYAAADSGDLAALQQVVEQAKARWGSELNGVIHLAGTFQKRMIVEESRESMAATLRPKIAGAWALHQLLQDNPNALFIHFSSVNGFFGGAMLGGVVAGNSFLDLFAHYQRKHSPYRTYCFAWSLWDETGMSKGYRMKRLAIANGYRAMSPQQGVQSLVAALHHHHSHLLIGLDGDNQHIRSQVATEPQSAQKLTAYLSTRNGLAARQLAALTIHDRFETLSQCSFVQLPRLPRAAEGGIDRSRLQVGMNRQGHNGDAPTAPRNEIELQVIEIWQQVLNTNVVNIHDNFFELGGNSLLAAQTISRLRASFGLEISVRHFFEAPTVAALAEQIALLRAAQVLQSSPDLSNVEREEDGV